MIGGPEENHKNAISLSSGRDSFILYLAVLLTSVSIPQPEGAAMQHAQHQSVVCIVPQTQEQRAAPHREGAPRRGGAAAEATPGHGQQTPHHQEPQDGAGEARHHRVSGLKLYK